MVRINRSSKQLFHYRAGFTAKSKQQGVVLVVSLVFLVALTAVASALMLNTTTDMKMSGASEEKVVATQEAFGAIDEIIYRQVKATGNNVNTFAQPIQTFKDAPTDALLDLRSNAHASITKADIGLSENAFALESDCPHSRLASSTEVFTCNVLKIELSKKYGRKNTSTLEVNAGIAQQLLR